MDDELFRKKLTEVAVWEIPKSNKDTSVASRRRRGRRSNEELFQDEHEQQFLEEHGGINPTYPPNILSVKAQSCDCPDCGKVCANGRKVDYRLHQKNDKRVWREHCMECRKFKNPFNGKFELTGSAASIKFNEFMRGSKMKYNTKANQERRRYMIEHSDDKTVIEDEQSKITFYHHNKSETK